MLGYHIENEEECYSGDTIMDDSSDEEFKRWFMEEIEDFMPGSKLFTSEYLGNREDGYDCNNIWNRKELNSIQDLKNEFDSYLKTIDDDDFKLEILAAITAEQFKYQQTK